MLSSCTTSAVSAVIDEDDSVDNGVTKLLESMDGILNGIEDGNEWFELRWFVSVLVLVL